MNVAATRGALEAEPDEDARRELALGVAGWPAERAMELVDGLLARGDERGRVLAAEVLATLSSADDRFRPAVHARVRAGLLGAPAVEELVQLVIAAGHLAAGELRDLVLAHREHEHEDVRWAVAFALPSLEGAAGPWSPDTVGALVVLAEDEDDDVRSWALYGLGAGGPASGPVDTPEARAAYAANREHPEREVRGEALEALGLLGDVEALATTLAEHDATLESIWKARDLADPRLREPLARLRERITPVAHSEVDEAIAACTPAG